MKSLFTILGTLIIITFSTITSAESIFRSTPVENFSKNSVIKMLKNNDFYELQFNKSASGFPNDYELQKNGKVVYDRASGLMWQQSGSDEAMSYKKAKTYVKQLNRNIFAGYSDWRLPTLEEGMSLVEPIEKKDHNIDPIFDHTQYWIWTSDLDNYGDVWYISYADGSFSELYPNSTGYVRAVR